MSIDIEQTPLFSTSLQPLLSLARQSELFQGLSSLLHWDQETQMPPKAATLRSEQLELLASLRHRHLSGGAYRKALGQLIDLESGEMRAEGLDELSSTCLRRLWKDWDREVKLPDRFVKRWARLTSEALEVWKKARSSAQFALFAPWLAKIVEMSQKRAQLLGYHKEPYDALLDLYEEGMETEQLALLFDPVKKSLPDLCRLPAAGALALLPGRFPQEQQLASARDLLKAMGYDFSAGQLSLSTHPFCSAAHPTDCRLTLRTKEENCLEVYSVALHEGGHALYEMQLPEAAFGTPLGQASSMGVHESQSRFWEVYLGGSLPFSHYLCRSLRTHFPAQLASLSPEELYQRVNQVSPSCIRVEADEVTYPLHVILRFEIERKLIDGTLSVEQLPAHWNEQMEQLLGITPRNDAEGCLQDIHWSMGAFGYFPTYLLGNIYAAQLWDRFRSESVGWEERVAKGDLLFIKSWLGQKIHRHGRRYLPRELIEKATGQPLSTASYLSYLQTKYGPSAGR